MRGLKHFIWSLHSDLGRMSIVNVMRDKSLQEMGLRVTVRDRAPVRNWLWGLNVEVGSYPRKVHGILFVPE